MKQIRDESSMTFRLSSGNSSRLSMIIHDQKARLAGLFANGITCDLRSGVFYEAINGVTVPMVATMIRLDAGRRLLLYRGWINDLAPDGKGVLKALVSRPEIILRAASLKGRVFAAAKIPNSLIQLHADAIDIVYRLKKRMPWTEHHFAAARALVESQYPTPLELWQQLERPPINS